MRRGVFIGAAVLAALTALPWLFGSSVTALALTCFLYMGLAVSWSMFSGPTRTLSLATSGFFGLGAYTTAFLLHRLPWPILIFAGGVAAVVLALLIGLIILRLRGTYFAVLSFGLGELVKHAITNIEKSEFGTVGRVLTDTPTLPTVYFTVGIVAALAALAYRLVDRSDLGLALRGVGGDEERAATLGVRPGRVKLAGFALSAWFAGAMGAAMAVRWTYIDPRTVFSPFILFQTVLIAMVGGPMKLRGPILGAVLFTLVAEFLRWKLPYMYMILLGTLLIVSVLWLPDGLVGLRGPGSRLARKLRARA